MFFASANNSLYALSAFCGKITQKGKTCKLVKKNLEFGISEKVKIL